LIWNGTAHHRGLAFQAEAKPALNADGAAYRWRTKVESRNRGPFET